MTLKTTIAAPFRHLRKAAMKKSELVYYYALDRKWMSTEQAAMLLRNAEEDGLLAREGDLYKPAFDAGTVTIPIGFKPTSAIFDRKDAFGEAVTRIAHVLKKEDTEVVAEMNRLIIEGFDHNLLPEAAIAIIARRHKVCIDDLIPVLEKNMKKGDR
ncbi:MAG: hypothetical protein A4E35_01497 [Methanoregula sp. PtaU1.Bin051]|nr:MAG: hypothetical protein A4E35_01497 [Methanoregula sp. PtaU1.Bin051]